MKLAGFTEDRPGQLVKTREGGMAFAPSPLPPVLKPNWGITNLISQADRAMGELVGAAQRLPNPHFLMGPFLRREAILSSRIEGTITTAEELLLFEVAEPKQPSTVDVREVANYVGAMEYGLARLKEIPVCLRLIRELHERLLKGVRGSEHRPGEFRQIQNLIGRPGQPLAEARFVPPPVPEMLQALDEFERFLNSSNDLPILINLALIHYQFEAIHPFRDGNGRIGRLLMTLLLCERKVMPQPLLYLSAYFEHHRDEYMDHLLRISQVGAWDEWIRFFVLGVIQQSQDALERLSRLLGLWQQYREKLQSARSSSLQLQLIDKLFAYPAITVPRAAKLLKVTFRSAQLNINKLVKTGILEEATRRLRNRVYVAPEIIKIIDAG